MILFTPPLVNLEMQEEKNEEVILCFQKCTEMEELGWLPGLLD